MVDLLIKDARTREARDPHVWPLAAVARRDVEAAVAAALWETEPPLREKWLVADQDERLAGLVRTIRVPVPPIYDDSRGEPGLITRDDLRR